MRTFTRVRPIANAMRVLGAGLIFSGGSFFLPEAWIDKFLAWFGVEPMPHAALMRYVLLGAGYLQLALGVFIWIIAKDVVRYRPFVIATIAVFLVGAPAFYVMDDIAGMPRWWCLMDFTCCLVAGGVPLVYCVWPSKASPNTALEPTADSARSSASRSTPRVGGGSAFIR